MSVRAMALFAVAILSLPCPTQAQIRGIKIKLPSIKSAPARDSTKVAAPTVGSDTATATRPGRARAETAPATIPSVAETAPAASTSQWTPLTAAEWSVRVPKLIGKDVEVGGNLSTPMMISRTSSMGNVGWMRDANNKLLLTVALDQADDAQIAWMNKNKCRGSCEGVFVRGRVLDKGTLRLKEISFESRAGAEAAGVVIAVSAPDAGSSGRPKALLPPESIPPEGTPRWATEIPQDSFAARANRSMEDRSLYVRSRDHDRSLGIIRGPERPADFSTTYRSIRDTRLSRAFAAYPWNTGRAMWPRVALVVESVSPAQGLASGTVWSATRIVERCWQLSAKLWTGPAKSEDIPSFNWCLSEMRFNQAIEAIYLWGSTPKTSMMDITTGPNRTLGPNPPGTPAPRFHFRGANTSDTIMLGNILLDMGFDFGVPDGRVWVNVLTKP